MQQKELEDGLVLRWATPEDLKKVPKAVVDVFSSPDVRLESLGTAYVDIANGEYGFMTDKDCLVIIDTKLPGDPIAGFTSYWQETQTYEGIPYNAGRPAWVGILNKPEYRGKRLLNHIMEMLHARSEADSTMVQVIHGINWYYRQFGYEYALDFGKRSKVSLHSVPKLGKDESETLRHRRATLDDVDAILEFDKGQHSGCAVFIPMTKTWITSHIKDMQRKDSDKQHVIRRHVLAFEDISGKVVGHAVIVGFADELSQSVIGIYHIAFAPHVDIPSLLPSAMRNITAFARSEVDEERFSKFESLGFHVSKWHPVVEAIPSDLRRFGKLAYEETSYYVRVPDLCAFVQHIVPALNQRLKQSMLHTNYTGSVKLSNYTPRHPGIQLDIENGVITNVSPYVKRDQLEDAEVAYFPPHTFLQVLFGRRSIAELQDIFPDIEMEEDIEKVLSVLFPKRISIIHHYM